MAAIQLIHHLTTLFIEDVVGYIYFFKCIRERNATVLGNIIHSNKIGHEDESQFVVGI